MNLQGTIYKVGEVQQISEKFKKREVVIKIWGDYPQFIGCQLTQDKCSLGDVLNVGDEVDASINLRGREWISPKDGVVKYFNTIEIWKLETIGIPQVSDSVKDAIPRQVREDEMDNDLPF